MFKKIMAWLIGKKILTETGELDAVSKGKLVAVIGVLLVAIPQLSKAWGHPVTIPDWVYKALGYAGLWSLRDAIPSKEI